MVLTISLIAFYLFGYILFYSIYKIFVEKDYIRIQEILLQYKEKGYRYKPFEWTTKHRIQGLTLALTSWLGVLCIRIMWYLTFGWKIKKANW